MTNNTNTTGGVATALSKVSVGEFSLLLILWLLYCCVGKWSPDQPLRIVVLIQSAAKILIINLWYKARDPVLSLFVVHLLGRVTLTTNHMGLCQGAAVVFWLIMDSVTVFFIPLRALNIVCEALMVVGTLGYVAALTMSLKKRGRGRWQLRLGAIFLWCIGWGIISVLCWTGVIDQLMAIVWFMTYAACIPKRETAPATGEPPNIELRSPWLASVAPSRS